MDSPKIYFAEVKTGGRERTALGYIPCNYTLFANFMPTKLNHKDDSGNTFRLARGNYLPDDTFVLWENSYGSPYTFNEFYNDMNILGFEVVHLPLCLSGGNGGIQGLVKYVEENYIE